MAVENDKIKIRLHVYDTDIQVTVRREDEEYCRRAAKLITDKVNSLMDVYRSSRSENEIIRMAMLDIAIDLEFEKSTNDTKPYDDILTKITSEIEDALDVKAPSGGKEK
jgi:cell division protein ZapA